MKLVLLILFISIFFPSFSSAEGVKSKFCVEELELFDSAFKLNSVQEFDLPPYEIYFFGNTKSSQKILIDGKLKEINIKSRDFYQLSDKKVIAYGRDENLDKSIFEYNKNSNSFEKIAIKGMKNLDRIKFISWSTPLNGYLLSQNGTLGLHGSTKEPALLFLVKNNEAEQIDTIQGWVTKIVDFPELNLTFLGTEKDDVIYIVSGNKNITKLGNLSLGEYKFFSNVYHLRDPDRLLVQVIEAMGPFKGSFIINLEKLNGIWQPSKYQNLKNVREKFTRPNKKDKIQNYNEYIVEIPNTEKSVVFKEEGVFSTDLKGNEYLIDNSLIEYDKYSILRHTKYLDSQNAVFVDGKNGLFLIKPLKDNQKCFSRD